MTDMCNFIADHGVAPTGWQTGSITMLPKPGDSKLATNYRGITVLSIVRKLLDRALNNRLSKNVTICPEQDGFRKNHSCPDQIWMLQSMIDQARARKMPLFACFVDFKKAYDRVWRDLLTIKLHDQAGVQGKVLRAILAMLKDSKGEIRYGGKASEYFAIAMGVAQGAISSPMLFSIFINDLTRALAAAEPGVKLNRRGATTPGLLYADDTAALSYTAPGLQRQMDALADFCRRWRLEVNEIKTKVMVFNGSKLHKSNKFTYGGHDIEIVDQYKYLGVWVTDKATEKGCWAPHIKQMIAKANKRVGEYDKLFRNKTLAIPFKLTVYKTMVRPILEYGAEVWWASDAELLSIERVQLKCAKMILSVPSTTATPAVLAELGLREMRTRYETIKLKFANRLCDMAADSERPAGKVWVEMMTATPADERPMFEATIGWGKQMEELFGQPEYAKLSSAVQERLVAITRAAAVDSDSDTDSSSASDSAATDFIRLPVCPDELDTKEKYETEAKRAAREAEIKRLRANAGKMTQLDLFKLYYPADVDLRSSLAVYFPRNMAVASWKAQRLIFQLRAGNAPIGVHLARLEGLGRTQRPDQVCQLCNHKGAEDQRHFLLHCEHPAMQSERALLFKSIASKLARLQLQSEGTDSNTPVDSEKWEDRSKELEEELANMEDDERLRVLLCDFRAKTCSGPVSTAKSFDQLLIGTVVNGVWGLFKARTVAVREIEKVEREQEEARLAAQEKEQQQKKAEESARKSAVRRQRGPGLSSTGRQTAEQKNKISDMVTRRVPFGFAAPSSPALSRPVLDDTHKSSSHPLSQLLSNNNDNTSIRRPPTAMPVSSSSRDVPVVVPSSLPALLPTSVPRRSLVGAEHHLPPQSPQHVLVADQFLRS
jgi:hypothetical protein